MEIRALSIEKREGSGKEVAKRLRRTGRVPAVLYGGSAPVNITVNPKDIFRLIHGHEGGTQLVQVTFNGSSDKRMAIIRDMQLDPVSEDLVHVDLQEVAMDKPIQVTVPLRHVGDAVGVRETKGILEMILREVQVSCLPGQIPEALTADVANLAIGDVFTVSQLPVPEGVRVLTDGNQAVATVAPPPAEEVVAAPAVNGGGGAGRARGPYRAEAQGEKRATTRRRTRRRSKWPRPSSGSATPARSTGTRATTWGSVSSTGWPRPCMRALPARAGTWWPRRAGTASPSTSSSLVAT